jgi:branched-chain amino acid transport system substrate-binding protein
MSRNRRAVTVVAVLAAAVLSACSSSSGGGSTSAAGATSGGAKGTPIVVGAICSCSGAQSAALALEKDVSQAWASSVNAAGGINGHPVKMIVEDDAGDPAKSLRAVKKLVEQDKVMAIVGDNSLVDATWASYVAAKGIPVVGGIPTETTFLTNPDFYGSGTSVPVLIAGNLVMAKAAGKTKIGLLYCAETPVCAQLDGLSKAAAAVVGGGITITSAKISATAPNYTAPCLALKQANIDGLFVGHNSTVVQRVVDGCAQQGFTPTVVSQTTTSGPAWLKDARFNGAILASPNAVPTETLPATKAFLDAMDKYYPGDRASAQFSFDTLFPWAGGKLFEAAAKAANIGPTSTPADVKKGLYALKDETLDGLAPPLNFVQGKPTFLTCYFTTGVENGAFTTPDGSAPKCLTTPQATALGKILGS